MDGHAVVHQTGPSTSDDPLLAVAREHHFALSTPTREQTLAPARRWLRNPTVSGLDRLRVDTAQAEASAHFGLADAWNRPFCKRAWWLGQVDSFVQGVARLGGITNEDLVGYRLDQCVRVLHTTIDGLDPGFAAPADAAGRCIRGANMVLEHLTPPPGVCAQLVRATRPGLEHWAVALVPVSSAADPEWMVVGDPTVRQFGAGLPYPYVTDVDRWLDDMVSDAGPVQVWLVDPDADEAPWVYADAVPWRTRGGHL